MAWNRQAPPDPKKAAEMGVANYVPKRRQIDTTKECADCPKTATWEVNFDTKKEHWQAFFCDTHRNFWLVEPNVTNYTERRLR